VTTFNADGNGKYGSSRAHACMYRTRRQRPNCCRASRRIVQHAFSKVPRSAGTTFGAIMLPRAVTKIMLAQ
jgi:hypothetical protein